MKRIASVICFLGLLSLHGCAPQPPQPAPTIGDPASLQAVESAPPVMQTLELKPAEGRPAAQDGMNGSPTSPSTTTGGPAVPRENPVAPASQSTIGGNENGSQP